MNIQKYNTLDIYNLLYNWGKKQNIDKKILTQLQDNLKEKSILYSTKTFFKSINLNYKIIHTDLSEGMDLKDILKYSSIKNNFQIDIIRTFIFMKNETNSNVVNNYISILSGKEYNKYLLNDLTFFIKKSISNNKIDNNINTILLSDISYENAIILLSNDACFDFLIKLKDLPSYCLKDIVKGLSLNVNKFAIYDCYKSITKESTKKQISLAKNQLYKLIFYKTILDNCNKYNYNILKNKITDDYSKLSNMQLQEISYCFYSNLLESDILGLFDGINDDNYIKMREKRLILIK